LGTIKFPEELKKASRSDQLDAAGIDQSQLRLMVARLVEASQSWTDATAAVASTSLLSNRTHTTGIQYGEIPEGTLPVRYHLVLQPLSICRNSRFAARVGGPSTEIRGSNGRS
jgi:hypothetical protein